MGRIISMRYIIVTLATPYGDNDVRYLYTDMSDAEIEQYVTEEAIEFNQGEGYDIAEWSRDMCFGIFEWEYPDYWDDYVSCICECCGWAETTLEECPEVDADSWQHL